jgi:hypothetical protein
MLLRSTSNQAAKQSHDDESSSIANKQNALGGEHG